jgi:hypothetical protein
MRTCPTCHGEVLLDGKAPTKITTPPGFTKEDMAKIRAIAVRLVEGLVIKGDLNPEDPVALKKAVLKAGQEAKQVYNAALEYISG